MGSVKCSIQKVSIWAQVKDWETIARLANYLSTINELTLTGYKPNVGMSGVMTVEFYADSLVRVSKILDRIDEDNILETIKGLDVVTAKALK